MNKNKNILKIRNKSAKLIKEDESDPFKELTELVTGTVGDIVKFINNSSKFWGNTLNLLVQTSYYTFRAKVLKNMSQEEFDKVFKKLKDDFVDNTDRNTEAMKSDIGNMLSAAGVSEKELNTYLGGGLPGFNVLDKINVSKILTGRVFDKTRYTKINPVNHAVIDLIYFYMIVDLSSMYKAEQFSDTLVKSIKTDTSDIYPKVITDIKNFFRSNFPNVDAISKLEIIKTEKSKEFLDLIKNSLDTRSLGPTNIKDEGKAKTFIGKLRDNLKKVKKNLFSKSVKEEGNYIQRKTLRMTGSNTSIIKEGELSKDAFSTEFMILINSIAVSIIWLNENIRELILKKEAEEIENLITNNEMPKPLVSIAFDSEKQSLKIESYIRSIFFEIHYNITQYEFIEEMYNRSSDGTVNYFKNIDKNYDALYKKIITIIDDEEKNYSKFLENKNKEFFKNTKEIFEESEKLKKQSEAEVRQIKDKDAEIDKKMNEYFKFIFQLNMLQATKTYLEGYIKEKNESADSLENSFKRADEIKNNANYVKYFSDSLKKCVKLEYNKDAGSNYSTLQSNIEKAINIADVNYKKLKEDYENLLNNSKESQEDSKDKSDKKESSESTEVGQDTSEDKA